MSDPGTPRYPIYIPSYGRAETALTPQMLEEDGVDYKIVVEAPEWDLYAEQYGEENLLELPEYCEGPTVIPVRQWIMEHAEEQGYKRHWQLDDNLVRYLMCYGGERIPAHAGLALSVCEDFTDRYSNIGISGLSYYDMVPSSRVSTIDPYRVNVAVYSNLLIHSSLANELEFRGPGNEDTDFVLQVINSGLCSVRINEFMVEKYTTTREKRMDGGNSEIYEGDGRYQNFAEPLRRRWPNAVEIKRKYGRPQHHINWGKIKGELEKREDLDEENWPPYDYNLNLEKKDDIEGQYIQRIFEEEATS